MTYTETAAEISPCGKFRYWLSRDWNHERETCVFAMLNPSTADGTEDDPTIRRCVGFAGSWGFGRLVVVNLFALRATNPDELRTAADPVGPENDRWLFELTAGRKVFCAWGSTVSKWPSARILERPAVARKAMQGAFLYHLGLTKGGHPKHPLYLPASVQPVKW